MTADRGGRRIVVVAVLAAVGALAAGCSQPSGSPAGVAAAAGASPAATAPGDVADVPVPGSTLAPEAVAGDAVVPEGFAVEVVLPEALDAATTTIADAVDAWAGEHGAVVSRATVTSDARLQDAVDTASEDSALLVVAGDGLIDEVDVVSAQNLGVQFLMLGSQVLEPTDNVTAVVWPGASSRGSSAPADEALDPASVTRETSAEAVTVGVASVLDGVTGIVVALGDRRSR